jgi:FG-GAP-like repeat
MATSRLNWLLKKSRPVSRTAQRHTLSLVALEDRTVPTFLPAVPFPVGVRPGAVAVADFNNDLKPDLAVVNLGPLSTSQSSVSVLLGNGNGSFQPAVTTTVFNSGPSLGVALSLAVGDFNGDGLPDVALNTLGAANSAVEVMLGKGDGHFQPDHPILPVGQSPFSVAVGDLDGNGALDIVTANGSGTLSVLLGNGDGSFQTHVDLPVGGAPRAVAVDDFNRDGKLDIVTAQQLTDTVSVLLGQGNGKFASPLVFPAGGQDFTPESLVVADVNGDKKVDLVIKGDSVLESDAFQVGVLLGHGDGTFQAPLLGAAQPGGSGGLAVGDFNDDGRQDVAVADQLGSPSGNLSVFAGNGDGTFQSLIRLDLLTGGSGPFGVAAADLTGDGLEDLIATNSGDAPGTVGVLSNVRPPRVADVSINGGAAERSLVNQIRVDFDQHVTLPANAADAFRLVRQSDGAPVTLHADVDDTGVGVGTRVTLSFTGGAVNGRSLADGRFTLTVTSANVSSSNGQLDGDGNGVAGGNFVLVGNPATNKLFRLFGDADGDGTVAANDFVGFRGAFGAALTAENALFDFDGDGAVSASDFIQFRNRFNTSI